MPRLGTSTIAWGETQASSLQAPQEGGARGGHLAVPTPMAVAAVLVPSVNKLPGSAVLIDASLELLAVEEIDSFLSGERNLRRAQQ
jgi:hypothetical protein